MNKNLKFAIVGLVIFFTGFFAGMEYKAYEIRSALKDAFSDVSESSQESKPSEKTVMEKAKKENMKVINKKIGDELVLATGKIKVNSAEEDQKISASYSSPKVAKEGTKFVIVGLNVTNTTKSAFSFSPDDVFKLVDDKNREFSTYSESIGGMDNYLNYRELPPSVEETGFLVYEIPKDAQKYSLITSKEGTKELYKIILK